MCSYKSDIKKLLPTDNLSQHLIGVKIEAISIKKGHMDIRSSRNLHITKNTA